VRKGKAVANPGSTYVLAIDNLTHKTPKGKNYPAKGVNCQDSNLIAWERLKTAEKTSIPHADEIAAHLTG
jgi:hypothetical protein